jgi:hypothetical protein
LAGAKKLSGGSPERIDVITAIIGDDNNTASAGVRDFRNLAMQLAVFANPFLPDPETHAGIPRNAALFETGALRLPQQNAQRSFPVSGVIEAGSGWHR